MTRSQQLYRLHELKTEVDLINQVLEAKLKRGDITLSKGAAEGLLALAEHVRWVVEQFRTPAHDLDQTCNL